jgi:hypothetical protein
VPSCAKLAIGLFSISGLVLSKTDLEKARYSGSVDLSLVPYPRVKDSKNDVGDEVGSNDA